MLEAEFCGISVGDLTAQDGSLLNMTSRLASETGLTRLRRSAISFVGAANDALSVNTAGECFALILRRSEASQREYLGCAVDSSGNRGPARMSG